MGLSSGTRFGFGHRFGFGRVLRKASPMQECSRRTGSGMAVRNSGKVVKGLYTLGEHVWGR